MSAQIFAQAIGAGATITLPNGRYFYIKLAAAALTLTARGNTGSPARFANIGAGAKFGPVAEGQGWRFLDVFSAAAQNIEIVISDDGNFEIASAVTIAGVAQVQVAPASAIATPAADTIPDATALAIPANLSRVRLTICADENNTGNVYVQATGSGAGRGIPVQPGMATTIGNTAAIDVRNDTGGDAIVTRFEES